MEQLYADSLRVLSSGTDDPAAAQLALASSPAEVSLGRKGYGGNA
jgi:hypothetical protein